MRGAFFWRKRIPASDTAAATVLESSREQHRTRTLITTMNETQPKGKILRGTEGVGTMTQDTVDERAREIACSDGRAEANDLDRAHAREDLIGSASGSEQVPTVGEPDGDWYTPRGSSGEEAPTVRPEDEENIPEKLIQEGIEEADHDQRSKSGRVSER
jgi:hypothetical protein